MLINELKMKGADPVTLRSGRSHDDVLKRMFQEVLSAMPLIQVAAAKQSTCQRETNIILMLYLLGIVVGLLFIIMCFSKGLKDGSKPNKSQYPESSVNVKKNDLSEEDVHLLARILSVGLVDADPNYLHHLKMYRDLHGR